MHHVHRYGRRAVRLRLRPHVPAPEPAIRSDATVGLGGDRRRAAQGRFGTWRVTTPLNNVKGAEVTGPYAVIKTAGPARLAITDRGITFATNGRRGVRIDFRTPVPGIDPLRLIKHPELTVTVEDCERLATLLSSGTH